MPDAEAWLDRVHVHGVDLLDLAAVAGLLESVQRRFSYLDILVNNAAQTIRRSRRLHTWQRVTPEYDEVPSGERFQTSGFGSVGGVRADRTRLVVCHGDYRGHHPCSLA
ncbi:hypothetical protein [Nonomuraea sp. NPDC049400]|uniref:hypothetical protein n=1 Tax=Nonomuraea sp. NPDC049400 TaxID=3364352 RepID=UPI003788A56F